MHGLLNRDNTITGFFKARNLACVRRQFKKNYTQLMKHYIYLKHWNHHTRKWKLKIYRMEILPVILR